MKSVKMISTWRDVTKRDECRDKLMAIKKCKRPYYRVACKRLVVNRNCLTRSEHTEILSTPKGYLWTGARGLSYVLKDCKRMKDFRRRQIKPKKDTDAMWQEFVKQFLRSAKDSLSQPTKTILPKILMSRKNLSDPHLNPECNSSKWKQDFLKSLSSLIFDYIVQVLYCDRTTKNHKILTSEILKKLNDIAKHEHESLLQPSQDNYLREVQIFIANILSPWLVKSIGDFCKGANTDLQIKSDINNNYDKQWPNNKRVRNGSHKNYLLRPSHKKPVKLTLRDGHENESKTIKKTNVKGKSKTADDNANGNNVFESDIGEKHSKAGNGLIIRNENGSKSKIAVTRPVKTTKRNRGDGTNVRGYGSNEKDVKTKNVRKPKLRIRKNKNNSKKTVPESNKKSSGVRGDGESKKRHNREDDNRIGENGRTITSNEKRLGRKSRIEHDDTSTATYTLRGDNGIDARKDSVSEKSKVNDGVRLGRESIPVKSDGTSSNNDETNKKRFDRLQTERDRNNSRSSDEKLPESESRMKYNGNNINDDIALDDCNRGETNEKTDYGERADDVMTDADRGNRGEIIAVKSGDRVDSTADGDQDNDNNDNSSNNNNNVDESRIDEANARNDYGAEDTADEKSNAKENRAGNDQDDDNDAIDADRGIHGDTNAVKSDDGENGTRRYKNTGSEDDNGKKTSPSAEETDGCAAVADRLNNTRSYGDDIRGGERSNSCVSDGTNAFLKESPATDCSKRVAETAADKFDEPKEVNCFERYLNNALKFTVDEMKNKVPTDLENRGNPGIIYRICKNDGSNYSVRKTILPICENGDPMDPALKAKL